MLSGIGDKIISYLNQAILLVGIIRLVRAPSSALLTEARRITPGQVRPVNPEQPSPHPLISLLHSSIDAPSAGSNSKHCSNSFFPSRLYLFGFATLPFAKTASLVSFLTVDMASLDLVKQIDLIAVRTRWLPLFVFSPFRAVCRTLHCREQYFTRLFNIHPLCSFLLPCFSSPPAAQFSRRAVAASPATLLAPTPSSSPPPTPTRKICPSSVLIRT